MSDNRLTAENVRAAAEVHRELDRQAWSAERPYTASELDVYADRLEREQAVEAKRAKRIEELARECFNLRHRPEWLWDSPCANRNEWRRFAAKLLDAHPSLLDEPKEQK